MGKVLRDLPVEIVGFSYCWMGKKSYSQPPGMFFFHPVNNWIFTISTGEPDF